MVRVNGHRRYAHRVVWEAHNGPIPAAWVVHHLCLHPECLNPDHLKAMPKADHDALHAALRKGQPRARPSLTVVVASGPIETRRQYLARPVTVVAA